MRCPGSSPGARTTSNWELIMTDPTHLNDLCAACTKPLSRKLVESFRDSARDPSVAKADYVQRLKNEMEAALEEGQGDAASQSNNP
jgi:hypothetical protein